MAEFAQESVQRFKFRETHTEQKMKNRIENAAGVFGRERTCGFDRDQPDPQAGRDPGFDQLLLVGGQA